MVAAKIKLKILETISADLAKHVDNVYSDLVNKQNNLNFSIHDLINDYLADRGKSIEILSKRNVAEAVEAKRDIAFIYYCLSCPFYFSLGVNQRLSWNQTKIAYTTLNIDSRKFYTYLSSAKHYYRIYSDYRDMINSYVLKYIKKE